MHCVTIILAIKDRVVVHSIIKLLQTIGSFMVYIKDILNDEVLFSGHESVRQQLLRTVKELKDTAYEYDEHLK